MARGSLSPPRGPSRAQGHIWSGFRVPAFGLCLYCHPLFIRPIRDASGWLETQALMAATAAWPSLACAWACLM